MGPRVPDPTDEVIPVEAFEDMDGPLIQGFLKNVSPGKREKMRMELAKNTPGDRRFMIFPTQKGIDGDVGNKLESVTLDQSQFGICDIMGMRNSQEDSVSCAVMPGFKLLTQAEQDLVAKKTFAKMQTKHGKESLGIGSTMTVATAWKTPKDGGGYRVNTHTAYVGDSPAFIVIIKADGTIVCRKLNRSSHHPDPNKGWQGASNYNQETERYELPRTKFPLTKAIGDIDVEIEGLTHEPTIDHDEIDVDEGDKVLIVAGCDGMTEDLNNDDAQEEAVIGQIVSANRNKPVHEIAKELAKRSVTQGTKDNISCAVFEVTEHCASLNVNDGHGGQTIAKALRDEVYPTMLADIARELEYKNKIKELLSQVGAAAEFYVDLGREDHLADFRKLIRKLGKLDKNREDRSNEETYQQMLHVIEANFSKVEGKYQSRHPTQRSPSAFAEEINRNADEYHYPRMLSIILQKNLSKTPPATWARVKANSNFYAEKIFTGNHPKQYENVFSKLVGEILSANLFFSYSEREAIKKLIENANPKTHLGVITLINDKLNNNEPLGFDSSLIPNVINLMRLHDALTSMTREMFSTVDYIRHINSGKTAQEYYSSSDSPGLTADEAIPITILLLNQYHKMQLPDLQRQLEILDEIFPSGDPAYGIVTLSTAAFYIRNNPTIDPTPAEFAKDEKSDQKKRNKQLFYESFLATMETPANEIIRTLPQVNFGGDNTSTAALHNSLSYVYTGTKSGVELALLSSTNSQNNLSEIINLVKTARDEYAKLGRSTHTKDFDKLIATLTRIATDDKGYKETRMYAAIETAYNKEQKPPMSISRLFRSDSENADKFKDKINKNQKIFHYPRMLAVIMQHPALKKACETEEVRMKAAYHKVMPGIRNAYVKIAPFAMDYGPLKTELYNALQEILPNEDISKLEIRTREIDNAAKYGATILPPRRINQIADILQKKSNFPSFLITDMLNELIKQMQDPSKVFSQNDVKVIAQNCCGTDPRLEAVASFWGDMIENQDIDRVSNHLFDIIDPLKIIVANDLSLTKINALGQHARPAL